MALIIRKLGDPVLREKCLPVEKIDSELRNLVKRMDETLHAAPGRAGLSANQVGILRRVFVYDIGYGTRYILNPEIIEREGETTREEGCLSIPGVVVALPRATRVKVKCETLSGSRVCRVCIETSGFVAQIFQHECDHLNGILIVDRCSPEERRRVIVEYEDLKSKMELTGSTSEEFKV